MMSITKILILFIAIVFIGEVVNMHPNTDRPDVRVNELSETLSRLKLAVHDYTNFGVLTALLRTRLDSLQTSPPVQTTATDSIASQHSGWRKREQVKMRSEGGGFNSVVSHTNVNETSSMNSNDVNTTMPKIGVNRIRRLASDETMSSDKNITELASPTQTNHEPKMSAIKCLVSLAYPVSLPLQCTQLYFGFIFN